MRSDPFTGRYLFHLHTPVTDGQVAVREYCEVALRERLDRLIFLEHIRTAPTYDVDQFTAAVRSCAAAFGIPALVGFEAKVLPGGALDISPQHLAQADVLGIAEHGFAGDVAAWSDALHRALGADYGARPVVWVHPGLWLKRKGLLEAHEPAYLDLLRYAVAQGVRLEWNLRYRLLPPHLHAEAGPAGPVLGADAHRPGDIAAALAAL